MRPLIVSALIILCGIAVEAQSATRHEQNKFGLEIEVIHPVTITDAELAALSADEMMKRELDQDPPIAKLNREGLVASVVHLGRANERDIVVIGSGPPLSGANIGPFWLVRDLATGPQVVFSTIALGISIEKTRFRGLKIIEGFAATAIESTTVEFRFTGQKYVDYREKTGPNDQSLKWRWDLGIKNPPR